MDSMRTHQEQFARAGYLTAAIDCRCRCRRCNNHSMMMMAGAGFHACMHAHKPDTPGAPALPAPLQLSLPPPL